MEVEPPVCCWMDIGRWGKKKKKRQRCLRSLWLAQMGESFTETGELGGAGRSVLWGSWSSDLASTLPVRLPRGDGVGCWNSECRREARAGSLCLRSYLMPPDMARLPRGWVVEQKVGNSHLGEWEREWTREVTEQRLAHGRCLLNIGRVDRWMDGRIHARTKGRTAGQC